MEFIRADERGYFDHGWLKTFHTFSFADYYNPSRMNFGMLRVFNDDIIDGQKGFGMHPHDNMEIISIPLDGSLAHKDSLGEEGVISTDEIQVMTAGTGIRHSEFNPLEEAANFLQIWIFPDSLNLRPRYEQRKFNHVGWNTIQLLVSPDKREGSLMIHQTAFLSRISIKKESSHIYERFEPENGVSLFVIEGEISLNNVPLYRRDTALINPVETIILNAHSDSQLLFIEVPMN